VDFNLADFVTKSLAGPFAEQLAGHLGAPPKEVGSTLGALVPATLGTMLKANGTPDGVNTLLGLLNAPNLPQPEDAQRLLAAPDQVGSLLDMGRGQANTLFGDKLGGLGGALATQGALPTETVGKLLPLALPFILGLLRRQAGGGTIDAAGLKGLLGNLAPALSGKIPAALMSLLGLGSLFGGVSAAKPAAAVAAAASIPPAETVHKAGWKRWLPLLLIGALALWLLTQFRGCNETAPALPTASAPAGVATPEPAVPTASLPVPGMPAMATEQPASPQPASIFFDVDVTTPPAGSMQQLQALADFAKANPGKRLSVSGFHDKNGDAAHNKALAQGRGDAVKALLIEAGVPGEQIDVLVPDNSVGDQGDDRTARRVDVSVD